MELRHLRYFIKAAELLHFTKAAEALYISQPTLSVHIQQLEAELGSELFIRSGRQVRLTEAGEALLVRAREAVHQLELASEEIEAMNGLLRGTVSIGALPIFSSAYLPKWITVFNDMHPDVHIKARSGASDDIELALTTGVIDLAFTILPTAHQEIHEEVLFSDEIVIAVSRDHSLAARTELDVKDLHMLDMAIPSSRIATARLWREYLDSHDVQPNVQVEFDDSNALMAIAKMGRLAVVLPSRSIVNNNDLIAFKVPPNGLCYKAAAIWTRLSPAAKALLDLAISETKKTSCAERVLS